MDAEHHRVSEMVLERAKRLVEHKEDVVILLDSITDLQSLNLTVPPSGKNWTCQPLSICRRNFSVQPEI